MATPFAASAGRPQINKTSNAAKETRMLIVRIVPIAAISLATVIWFGGAAFAGSGYNPAPPIVDSGPSLIVSVKGTLQNRQGARGSRHKRQSSRGLRHNRNRHLRSHRRHKNSFSFGFGYSPNDYSRRSYYSGYSYYRPYSLYLRY